MSEELPADIDDSSIPDDELLYRRIPIHPPEMIQETDVPGEFRPSSGNFRSEGPLSIDRSSLSSSVQTRDRAKPTVFHVAGVQAKLARQCGCRIVKDPLPDNPAHVLIFGDHESGTGALSGKQTKAIARAARIVLLSGGGLSL
jgi:hypothetical protein